MRLRENDGPIALEDDMKRILGIALMLAACPCLLAGPQEAAQTNPVSAHLRELLGRASKNMVAAAEAMPADKYDFHPTPQQMTFAHLVLHIAGSNAFLCSKISGVAAPERTKLADTDGKDKLVEALKSSFEFCSTALAKVDDSDLGAQMTLFRNMTSTKAGAMFGLANDWADHYSAQAMYLRLNGILPPTAQPKKD
jgi:uncharacterized damage-inducible protein DinB